MQSLVIPPANYCPGVCFENNGILSLKGRSLMLDAFTFYEPLVRFCKELTAESVKFSIELDYFNTSSSKKILEMLKMLDGNTNIKEFVVYWRFESDDEETLFKGQILEERLKKAKFRYQELAGLN